MKGDKIYFGYGLPDDGYKRMSYTEAAGRALANVMAIPDSKPNFFYDYDRDERVILEDFLELLRKGVFPSTLPSGTVPEVCSMIIDLCWTAWTFNEDSISCKQELRKLYYLARQEWLMWSKEEGGEQ